MQMKCKSLCFSQIDHFVDILSANTAYVLT